MRRNRFTFVAVLLLLCAGTLLGQSSSTGALNGTVTQSGTPLPGVTVTISSPNLQGTRSMVTNEAGGYSFGALPPGQYTITFELQGLQKVTRRDYVGVAQASRVDTDMAMAVAEAITVTATSAVTAETTEVQTNFNRETIEELPTGRNVAQITLLAPGTTVNGPNNALMLSGGQSFDNLITVNGVNVQENLRGQPQNLFIEDAIQETTVQTAGISAEFGNFTGGVVNAITKSGGNEFSGSFRDNIGNPSWTENSPTTYALVNGQVAEGTAVENLDKMSHQYEATLGGRIIHDRLWFFLAGRRAESTTQNVLAQSNISYDVGTRDERLEGKLTGSINQRHSAILSYLEAPQSQTNNCQTSAPRCYDMTAVNPARELPNDFMSAFYNGVISDSLIVEARYSQRNFSFVNSGGTDQDRVTGTPIRLFFTPLDAFVNEPIFCGSCGDEERNSSQYGAKATYFLGTGSLGSHNIVVGFDRWHETRLSNNFQSPTNFIMISLTQAPTRDSNGNALVNIIGNSDWIQYWPIIKASLGSDLNTDALFINDRWDLSPRWQFNLGMRYDRNDSADSAGNTVADDSRISPRVGLTFDTFGNGHLRFNGSYGKYVGRLAETISGSGSNAGTPARYDYLYGGPDILNASPAHAMGAVWAWFDSIGGYANAQLVGQNIPGFSTRLDGTLKSPSVDEYTVGVSTSFSRGIVRADVIHRDWQDFYGSFRNTSVGVVQNEIGQKADLALVTNTDEFERTYNALQLQGQYRLLDRLNLGANYTLSYLEGNIVGETAGSGPVAPSTSLDYPEYTSFAANNPVGYLPQDQRHKLRAWAAYDLPTAFGNFNFSVLERFDSGTPYSHAATIDVRSGANFYGTGQAGGVTNPGYITPPTSVVYFFSKPGEFRFDNSMATDLAINYDTNPAWLRGVSLFAQVDVVNVFNQEGQLAFNTQIQTHLNNPSSCTANPDGAGCLKRFNPLAGDQPVEGVHWRKGPLFGKATTPVTPNLVTTLGTTLGSEFQLPRTYRLSLGLRF